jgi:hypothetical protein
VAGQFGVDLPDLGQGVPHAGADGLACPFGLVAQPAVPVAQPGGRGQLADQRVTFGAQRLGSPVAPRGLGVLDIRGQAGQPRLVRRLGLPVEHRVGTHPGEVVPDQGEDVHVGAAGLDQGRDVGQAFGVGQPDLPAPEAEQPHAVLQPQLVGRPIRRRDLESGQGLLRQAGPPGGSQPFVHGQGGPEVRLGGGGVAERGRERAEVVVDGGVVGRAATHDHVGSGVRPQPFVHPSPLGVRARGREHDGRRGERFRARPHGDIEHAEIAECRGRRGGLATGGEGPGPEDREHRPQRVGRVHLDQRPVHPEGGQRRAGSAEAADGVRLADGQAELQRLLAESRRLLGPAGQLRERGLPGQRGPAPPGVPQVAGQGDVAEQRVPAFRVAEFQQRRGAQQVRLGREIVVAARPSRIEHPGDDGQPAGRRPRDPHRVVHRQPGGGQGARVVRGGRQPHGPVRGLADLGAGYRVRSVPERTGLRREHPGLQGQRAARCFEPPRGLAEQAEQFGVLRSRPVPEGLDAQRRPRQPDRVPGRPAGVRRLTEAPRGLIGLPGALV